MNWISVKDLEGNPVLVNLDKVTYVVEKETLSGKTGCCFFYAAYDSNRWIEYTFANCRFEEVEEMIKSMGGRNGIV